MELVVLGSGTTVPHGDRGCAAYALVSRRGDVLLLDTGPGSTRRYPRVGLDPRRIVGVVNTHHHADHVGELPILLFLRNVLEPPIVTPTTLAGPVGHDAFVGAITAAFAPGLGDVEGTLRIVEAKDGDVVPIGPFTVTFREVRHLPGSLGVKVVADGVSLAFSGDTGPCEALDALIAGVDLALLECSYPASRESTMHLTTRTAAESAARAGPRRLVLSHFYPDVLAVDVAGEVRAHGYAGPLVLARDELRIPIGESP